MRKPLINPGTRIFILLFTLLILSLGISACEPLTDLPQPPSTLAPTQKPPDPTPGAPSEQPLTSLPASPTAAPLPVDTAAPTATVAPEPILFAVIGDYGEGNQGELDVSELVKSWGPDFIITTGDNNYPIGSAETIDLHIGQYYHEFISPYRGAFGPGADQNRFFPTLGNHDWDTPGALPYLDYFELPGNERYYDFTWGPVHFFAVNSDSREPDGVSPNSPQALWLQERLATSTLPWKIVYFHHPPYSSGYHGPVDWMRWPFKEWGASAVLSGHDHLYERLIIGGIPYFINGLGGGPIYYFTGRVEGSQVQYGDDYGAMRVAADDQQMLFEFYTRRGELIDSYQITQTQ